MTDRTVEEMQIGTAWMFNHVAGMVLAPVGEVNDAFLSGSIDLLGEIGEALLSVAEALQARDEREARETGAFGGGESEHKEAPNAETVLAFAEQVVALWKVADFGSVRHAVRKQGGAACS